VSAGNPPTIALVDVGCHHILHSLSAISFAICHVWMVEEGAMSRRMKTLLRPPRHAKSLGNSRGTLTLAGDVWRNVDIFHTSPRAHSSSFGLQCVCFATFSIPVVARL
jgi:hypothetical protein